MGVLAGIGGAFLATTPASAGTTSSFNYSCAVLTGPYVLSATVSESPNLPGSAQVGGSYTESYSVTITMPAGLLNLAGGTSPPQTAIDIDTGSLNVLASGFTQANQTTTDVQVPGPGSPPTPAYVPYVTVPVNGTNNVDTPVTVPFPSLTWTTGPGIGTAALSPGVLNLGILQNSIQLVCTPVNGATPPVPTPAPAMDTMTTTSPPTPPVVQDQSTTVSSGQCTTINVLAGASDIGDVINPATVAVSVPTPNGTANANPDGTVTYCNTPIGTEASDSFTFTVKNTTGLPPGGPQTSNTGTVTVNISYNTCVAGTGNPGGGSGGTISNGAPAGSNGTGCSLHQLILLPVEPGQIVLSQNGGLPLDVLGSSFCGATPTTPGITLNGNEQLACGRVSPLTVTNATGLDTGWTLQGQTTDFNDPAQPSLTCDTVATYSNHCIPGGNLAWTPASAVAHSIVPGDTALVTSGSPIAPFTPIAPALSVSGILAGTSVQPNPVVEPSPAVGLQGAPATLCSTIGGQAGGTFICGAGLELVVPASIAEPTQESHTGQIFGQNVPAYYATLTLTLF